MFICNILFHSYVTQKNDKVTDPAIISFKFRFFSKIYRRESYILKPYLVCCLLSQFEALIYNCTYLCTLSNLFINSFVN